MLTTGEPPIKKWLVAPESEMASSTALHTFGLSKMVAAVGSCCKLLSCMMVFHAVDVVDMEI